MSWERSIFAGNKAMSKSDNSRKLLVSDGVAWADVLSERVERVVECVHLAEGVNAAIDVWRRLGGIMLKC